MKILSLKVRILIPLSIAFGTLLAMFLIYVYLNQFNEISSDVEKQLEVAQNLFDQQLNLENDVLSAAIELLQNNPQIQSAWLNKDRKALLKYSMPFKKKFEDEYRVTHVYFYEKNRTTFLRVHTPDKYGDLIDRYTLINTEKTGKKTAGFELGPLGTFTLRVVYPWRINNQLIGYIELGKEIENIINKMHSVINVELYISIYKKYLSREKWKIGMEFIGRTAEWNKFSDFVIICQTIENTPKIFESFLSPGHHSYMEMEKDVELSIKEKVYRIGVIPLYEADMREVGDMVLLYDVTNLRKHSTEVVLVAGIINFIAGVLLFMGFSKIISVLEKELELSHDKLVEESNAREKAQEMYLKEIEQKKNVLQKAHDELELMVKERTKELEESNEKLQIDITKRKKIEEELKHSRQELRNLSGYLQSAIERERIAIAREIHDELGQILTVLQIHVSELDEDLYKKKDLLTEKMKTMSKLIKISLSTVNRVSSNLRPNLLDNLGIIPAMRYHAKDFQTHTKIKCSISFNVANIALDKNLSTTIFRVFQELLTNAARHAKATHIIVNLNFSDTELVLTVSDNGRGITKKEISSSKSFGIIGIRERVSFWQGTVEISGENGTSVRVVIPFSTTTNTDGFLEK